MAALKGMELVKSTVMSLLEDSYQKRDKVGFIAIAGDRATVLLHPTSSVELAAIHLKRLPTEGKTPLSDGIYKGLQVLKAQLWKNRNIIPIMVLVSDGRGNIPLAEDAKQEAISLAKEVRKLDINLVVIDTEDDFLKLGYNKEIAEAGGGRYYRLAELNSKKVIDIVRTPAKHPSPSAPASHRKTKRKLVAKIVGI